MCERQREREIGRERAREKGCSLILHIDVSRVIWPPTMGGEGLMVAAVAGGEKV